MIKNDKYNEIILQELRTNGRISNTELAEKVGLSTSACLRRVQDLENKGVISGYRAILNNELLGNSFIAYVSVGLKEHTMASQRAFEEAIKSATEIKECHNVTGGFEYLLRIETRDISSFKSLHTSTLGSIPQVRTMTTHVVMESPKDERK
jgi:DNA-binding Lrp family transcriptional regulator